MHDGIFRQPVDIFAEPFWEEVRTRTTGKAIEMRRQGFFQPAMLPISELEYGGIVDRLDAIDPKFVVTDERMEKSG